MELAFSAFASRLTTLAFELIDRSFDHRLRGKERFDKLSYLVREINKRLAESGEVLSFRFLLYAQYIISIQISMKNASIN